MVHYYYSLTLLQRCNPSPYSTSQALRGAPWLRARARVSLQLIGVSARVRMGSSAAEAVTPLPSDDVLVQYVVLRRDLIDEWPLGTVVTQGCHASVSAIWSNKDDPHTLDYCSPRNLDSMHKVTLEVKGETQILNLSEKLKAGEIAHKLWIEQPENIPTCLATKPYPKSIVSSFFKKLKLCSFQWMIGYVKLLRLRSNGLKAAHFEVLQSY